MFTSLLSSDAKTKRIHAEIDSAQDRLLDQADKLLQELGIPTEAKLEEKAMRLEMIGFIKSEPVLRNQKLKADIQNKSQRLVKTKELAELIRYHKQTYPFQKFLTEEELDRICDKYSLTYAPIAHYKKDVPDKNIRDIEYAPSLRSSDVAKNMHIIKITCDIDGLTRAELSQVRKGIKVSSTTHPFRSSDILTQHFGKKVKCEYEAMDREEKIINRTGLFIAAPKTHFDLTGLSKEGKFGFLNVTIIPQKDPIVFRYVRGGVQVITKWGLEAKDEALTNAIDN